MAIRNILKYGDESLKEKSRAVTEYNKRLHELLDDMRDTLELANGVGLAAPQVGVLRRAVLVVDTNDENGEKVIELINPEITARSGEQEGHEGCLSLPGQIGIVKRPQLVKVRAFDRYGKEFEVWGEGLTARAMCHEIDHLDGVMYVDVAERMLSQAEIEDLNNSESDED